MFHKLCKFRLADLCGFFSFSVLIKGQIMARQKQDEIVVKLANELLKYNYFNNALDLQDVL